MSPTATRRSEAPWWVSATERIGVPTAFLAVVLYGLFRVMQPIAEEHVRMVQQQREILVQLRDAVSTEGEAAKMRTKALSDLLEEQRRTSLEQLRTSQLLQDLIETTQKQGR